MTILNITVTADRVVISSDSAVAQPVGVPLEGETSEDPAALALAFADPDHPVFPPAPTSYRRKIAVLPERRRIVAGAGMVLPVIVATGILALWGGGSIEDELGELFAGLTKLGEVAPAGASSGMVVVGAWEPDLGAVAYALASGTGWRPLQLGIGHAAMPLPHSSISGYADLFRRFMAPPGDDVEQLHRDLADNQAAAARRGLYRAGPAIGGELWMGTVDRQGAHQRVIGRI